jgi:elongation factor G
MAFKEGCARAKPIILEPVMAVEVVVPEDFMGAVVGDLSSRRGKIQDMDSRAGAKVVTALVPLAQIFGYATELRSMSQGRATYTMQFSKYEPVPQVISDEITAKNSGSKVA